MQEWITATKGIVAVAAKELIVSAPAVEDIVAGVAEKMIDTAIARKGIVAASASNVVIAEVAVDDISSSRADKAVVKATEEKFLDALIGMTRGTTGIQRGVRQVYKHASGSETGIACDIKAIAAG